MPKKNGTQRFCVDYLNLNEVTIPDSYPISRMDDCIDNLGDTSVSSALDANWDSWQMPIGEEDCEKTTVVTHRGAFRLPRMPFGLQNAPATFPRSFDLILSGGVSKFAFFTSTPCCSSFESSRITSSTWTMSSLC